MSLVTGQCEYYLPIGVQEENTYYDTSSGKYIDVIDKLYSDNSFIGYNGWVPAGQIYVTYSWALVVNPHAIPNPSSESTLEEIEAKVSSVWDEWDVETKGEGTINTTTSNTNTNNAHPADTQQIPPHYYYMNFCSGQLLYTVPNHWDDIVATYNSSDNTSTGSSSGSDIYTNTDASAGYDNYWVYCCQLESIDPQEAPVYSAYYW